MPPPPRARPGLLLYMYVGPLLCSRARAAAAAVPAEWERRAAEGKLVHGGALERRLPNLGNGYMAAQYGARDMYVAGVFSGSAACCGANWSHRAVVPWPGAVVPAAPLSAGPLALDFERGMVEQLVHRSPLSRDVVATLRTYFHRGLPHVAVTEVLVNNSAGATPLTVRLTDHFAHSSADIDFAAEAGAGAGSTCLSGRIRVAETGAAPRTAVAVCRDDPAPVVAAAGATASAAFVASVWTSLDALPGGGAPVDAARAELRQYSRDTGLAPGHIAAMRELWEGRIEVEGDAGLAATVNSSMWNVLIGVREGLHFSTSPGGLSNGCYQGMTFWDVEQYIWPNLNVFAPGIARDTLQYRLDRVTAAAAKAQDVGYAGLMWPWQASVTGVDDIGDASSYGSREIHINGDVSFALWQYWQAAGDAAWLRGAWPALRGTAAFWASRASRRPGGALTVDGVMDVDEQADGVNNSAYTNAGAKLALLHAARAAEVLGEGPVPGNWTEIAEGLRIPFDAAAQRHLQQDGPPRGTDGHGNGLGVVLMQYPLAVPDRWGNWTEAVRRNDLEYWDGKWSSANAMAVWPFVVGYLSVGDAARAADKFQQTTARNVFGPFKVWTENPGGGGCPNFVTGAGGYLQSVWAGYGGVRLTDDALLLRNSTLPPGATGLLLRGVAYRGARVDIRVRAGGVSVRLSAASPPGAPPLYAAAGAAPSVAVTAAGTDFPRGSIISIRTTQR